MKASLTLHKDYVKAQVDPRLFSGFMEHLGRVIYGDVYDPAHPMADVKGFRADVLDLVRPLQPTLVRYPGGNFVSAYNWEDGIGPRESRLPRLDVAWGQIDSNAIGVHEFDQWAQMTGAELMMAVNLGTRGPEAARDLVEYMNHPGGSRFSDWRIRNGRKEPFDVKLWCLGNEMDGPWQAGHKTPLEYGRIANEAGKLMRWVDPSIELVASGSSFSSMPTFGQWEDTVLAHCLNTVDYISLHTYYGNHSDHIGDFLAQSMDMGLFINHVVALADAAAAKQKSRKRINLSFDEWNVWSQASLAWPGMENEPQREQGKPRPHTFKDALLVALMLLELINHADRVKIGCFTMLTSCIDAQDPAARAFANAIYYPFLAASTLGRGAVLQPVEKGPRYSSRYFDDVPVLESASVYHEEEGKVVVFVVNRSDQQVQLSMDVRSFGKASLLRHDILQHDDMEAINTTQMPQNVAARKGAGLVEEGTGQLLAQVAPLSFNVYQLAVR